MPPERGPNTAPPACFALPPPPGAARRALRLVAVLEGRAEARAPPGGYAGTSTSYYAEAERRADPPWCAALVAPARAPTHGRTTTAK